MGRSINTGTLNKQYVLSKVSQITIFSTYLNLSDATVQYCIDTGEFILSPLRYDINPTCGFRYDNKNRLKFKDFAGYFWGDCFDVVAFVMSNIYKRQFNISDKDDFVKVLRHITLMFKDIFYGEEKDINLITDINTAIQNIKSTKNIIEFVIRDWTNTDTAYWSKFGVSLHDLNLEFIYPLDQYYINRHINPEPRYYYDTRDLCYGYLLGKDKNHIANLKVYFPHRPKGDKALPRFITNCDHLEGIYTLDRNDYDIILVTKSSKDRVSAKATIRYIQSLYRQVENIRIGFINIPHETYYLRQNEYDWLKSKLNADGIICSLMDNDRVGKRMAKWLLMNFVITPFLIPKEYNNKDFAEWREKQGIKRIINPIIDVITNIKKYEKEIVRKHYKLTGDSEEGDTVPF